ncbi:MAG: DNA primase [Pseudomonadota bacterium]
MGGHQVTGVGSGDDGYDEDGYDESQRAEILEATRDGPSDGTILLDLAPDLGGDVEDPDEDDLTDLKMGDGEIGEETRETASAEDDDEDDAQDAFDDEDADEDDDDTLDDGDDVALKP